MPNVKVKDINLYYEIHGQGDPLVLIMGLRRNIEWWYRQIPTLSKYFKVLAFDNRGAGRSDKPVMDYSIRLFADDTAGLMEALGIKGANILGLSMGGYIAQELTINCPGMVKSLILACTSAGGEKSVLMSPERMKKFTANEGLSPEQILQKDMDIYFSDKFVRENPEKIKEFIEISLRYCQPPDAFMRQFSACLKHDTADNLHRIKGPVLILSGDDDPLVPPENSRILKELIPHAELQFFPGCRHCFFIEERDRFNQTVVNFFKKAGQK
ncbi:MAG: alpha/beta hydrolase [Deltaproteobacteria bacterium]|nr:alpha/beta hydrolase [Deltaproteobacteria bacterium]